MRRSFAAFACAILVSALLAGQAGAGAHWCEEDPVFLANGNLIDVTTTFDSTHADEISGAVYFVLFVPRNTLLPAVVSVDGDVPVRGYISPTLPSSFSLLGGTPAVLNVWMSARANFPTYTRITGVTTLGTRTTLLNTVQGSSRTVQSLSFRLPLSLSSPLTTDATSVEVPELAVPSLELP